MAQACRLCSSWYGSSEGVIAVQTNLRTPASLNGDSSNGFRCGKI